MQRLAVWCSLHSSNPRKDGLTTSTGPWSGSDSGTGVSGSTKTSRMGITYDVVPRMLGESPNAAVARVYGVDDINEHLADEGLPPVAVLEHPPQAFDDWRTLILTRVLALDDWFRVDDGNVAVILWSARWNWQFELLTDSVTLRAREGPPKYERTLR